MTSLYILDNLLFSNYIIAPKSILKHGDKRNEQYGGTCAEFLQINNRNQCCHEEDDEYIGNECYMIHFETRCYCDTTCNSRLESDCCPDANHICKVHPVTKKADKSEAPSKENENINNLPGLNLKSNLNEKFQIFNFQVTKKYHRDSCESDDECDETQYLACSRQLGFCICKDDFHWDNENSVCCKSILL